MNESDIAMTAQSYFSKFGRGASIRAAIKAGVILERGDLDRALSWKKVAEVAQEMLRASWLQKQ